jgi:acetate kinase
VLALIIASKPRKVAYSLYSVDGGQTETVIKGSISDIGLETPLHEYDYGVQGRGEGATIAANHHEAFARIASVLASRTTGAEDYSQMLDVITHRVPHGGQRFRAPVFVSEEVMSIIDTFSPFAPMGNPAALEGMRAALDTFPAAPHVAVFDTAFHQSMPAEAYLYPLPYELFERRGLRRFGFHSISHRHAIGTAASELGTFPEAIRVLSLHIGEETSASAFAKGRCVDTTSGLTVQAGLPGATSGGCIDPAALSFLLRVEGFTPQDLDHLLATRAGLLGLSGCSSKLTEIVEEADKGDERCRQTLDVYVHHLTKAVGGLIAVMGGVDLLVITGDQGASCPRVRAELCVKLAYLGIELDPFRNEKLRGEKAGGISTDASTADVFVVPSDDETTIAFDSLELVTGSDSD